MISYQTDIYTSWYHDHCRVVISSTKVSRHAVAFPVVLANVQRTTVTSQLNNVKWLAKTRLKSWENQRKTRGAISNDGHMMVLASHTSHRLKLRLRRWELSPWSPAPRTGVQWALGVEPVLLAPRPLWASLVPRTLGVLDGEILGIYWGFRKIS